MVYFELPGISCYNLNLATTQKTFAETTQESSNYHNFFLEVQNEYTFLNLRQLYEIDMS